MYIHDLQTRYGSKENAQIVLRTSDERDELQRRVYELDYAIKLLNHPDSVRVMTSELIQIYFEYVKSSPSRDIHHLPDSEGGLR